MEHTAIAAQAAKVICYNLRPGNVVILYPLVDTSETVPRVQDRSSLDPVLRMRFRDSVVQQVIAECLETRTQQQHLDVQAQPISEVSAPVVITNVCATSFCFLYQIPLFQTVQPSVSTNGEASTQQTSSGSSTSSRTTSPGAGSSTTQKRVAKQSHVKASSNNHKSHKKRSDVLVIERIHKLPLQRRVVSTIVGYVLFSI